VSSACPLDCPDSCSLDVTLEDGKVVKLDGSHRNPITDGYICSKVRRFPSHLYGEARLRHPLRRVGKKGEAAFEVMSWDDALDLVAAKIEHVIDASGAESILPFSYGGSNGALTEGAADERLFFRLGTSRLARTVCAIPTGLAASEMYGKMPGVDPKDFALAKLIVVWGANPSVSSIHLVPLILEAQKNGAKLVVVDPRRTKLAKKADLHLAVRPGTDLPVTLAVIRELFETGGADHDFLATHTTGSEELRRRATPWNPERAATIAGIDPDDIRTLTRWWVTHDPAVVRCGWGQERNRNGGSASAAILALPAVAGKFGQRGGGYLMSNSSYWRLSAEQAIDAVEPETRIINMNRLGRTLHEADPAVELLFVYNANPLSTLPEQNRVRTGLERDDLFTVVFDQVMTDTARYADVVLPATTFLEHRDIQKGYGPITLHDIKPVIEPVGESRSNFEVFTALAERLGVARPGDPGIEEVADTFLSSAPDTDLRARVEATGTTVTEDPAPVAFVDAFPRTSDEKIHLVPTALDNEAPGGLYHYRELPTTQVAPLSLISPATNRTVSSTLGQLYDHQESVGIHPDDARARGIDSGTTVRVWNHLGEVHCRAKVDPDLRPGVASLAKGIWTHNTLNGASSNALVPDSYTDIGEGACFNDARVQIEAFEVAARP
ncbi:MAG: molybdopterin-dependent oxidoreductase, partial [Acidobacteriota bacterium]